MSNAFILERKDLIKTILACPQCTNQLQETREGVFCQHCNANYPNKDGQIDLRLKKNKKVSYSFILTPSFSSDPKIFHILPPNPYPNDIRIKLEGIPRELTSYVPKAQLKKNVMLDLGCGKEVHKEFFTNSGFRYIGLDYNAKEATLLGDAHALPFKDNSFDFIFSRAVIEHLQYPLIAMNEAYRVLKSKSKFVGTAAFLEPFHCNSFCHYTHLGLFSCLENAGFQVQHIAPNPYWNVLTAQARMGLFPKMPPTLQKIIIAPLQSTHRMWWKIGKRFNPEADELKRLLWTAGSLMFVAQKVS